MAVEIPGFSKTYLAGADLSTGAQFRFVKFNGEFGPTGQPEVILCAAVTDVPCGILQDNPKEGIGALVMINGESKLVSSAALAIGAFVGTSNDGRGDAKVPGTDTTEYIAGRVSLASGAANELCSVVFDCSNPSRGA